MDNVTGNKGKEKVGGLGEKRRMANDMEGKGNKRKYG
jgi:hypothetical protein